MAIIDWTLTGLIPTSGLLAWHLYNPTTSTGGLINDASGNSRHLVQASTPPALTLSVMNGQPGWYFNGTSTNPLVSTGSVTPYSAYVLASAEGAAFTAYRGLLSGTTTANVLTSENTGTKFFSFGPDFNYRKSDTEYADADMQAPMNNQAELIEITRSAAGGFSSMDGIQVGQQLADTTRKWKGYFFEQMLYDRILTITERRKLMLYFNIKYGTWAKGVPLYFPSKDLVEGPTRSIDTGPVNNRFYEEPPDYGKVTDSWQYEDANEDFNEVASSAPRRWEYGYKIWKGGNIAAADAYRAIFDEFYNQARKANPFYFRDKYGKVWENVRIEDYDRNHSAHKSWEHDVLFRLKTNSGTFITADSTDNEYIIFGGIG